MIRPVVATSAATKQSILRFCSSFWIASSRSLSSGAYAREPLPRNDVGEHRSPDGAKRNPGRASRESRIALRSIRATPLAKRVAGEIAMFNELRNWLWVDE